MLAAAVAAVQRFYGFSDRIAEHAGASARYELTARLIENSSAPEVHSAEPAAVTIRVRPLSVLVEIGNAAPDPDELLLFAQLRSLGGIR